MSHLTLSGGGTRGVLAHAGAMQYLLDHRIPVDAIAGTSAGALVAYLLTYRDDPAEVAIDLLGKRTLSRRYRFPRFYRGYPALYPNEPIYKALKDLTHGRRQKRRLKIYTANLATRKEHVWDSVKHPSAPWTHVALASMTIPGVFHPIRIHGQDHVDGGLCSNFALDAWRGVNAPRAGLIVTSPQTTPDNPKGVLDYLSAVVNLAINANVREDIEDATPGTRIIRLTGHGSSLNFKITEADARALVQWGYRQMKQQWETK